MNVTNAQIPRARLSLGGHRARTPPDRRGARCGWRSSCDVPGRGSGAARAGPGPGAGVAGAGASGPRRSRAGASRAGGHGRTARPRRTRTTARGRPRPSCRTCRGRSRLPRRVLARRSRPRSRRLAMRWTACGPRSPITPIGWRHIPAKLDLLKVATEALAASASGVAAQTAQHVTAATDLQSLISGAVTTLDLFPDHSTPEWVQLAAELAATRTKVDAVVSTATAIQTEAARVSAAVQQLKADIDTLTDGAHDLAARGGGIRDQLALIIAAAQDELAARLETAGSKVAALGSQADDARSNLAQHDRERQSTHRRDASADDRAARSGSRGDQSVAPGRPRQRSEQGGGRECDLRAAARPRAARTRESASRGQRNRRHGPSRLVRVPDLGDALRS